MATAIGGDDRRGAGEGEDPGAHDTPIPRSAHRKPVLLAQLLQVRAQRDRRERADRRRARPPRRRRAARPRRARPPRAPRAACARARRGGRGTRRASRRGRHDLVAVARADDARASSARSRRRPSRYSRSRPETNTLPSPSTASPVNAARPATNTRWSSAWPGTASTSNGPKRSPSPSVRTAPDRHAEPRRAARGTASDVVGVVVRQRDPARAAARRDLGGDRVEVRVDRRPGIDHPRRVAADDPGVRARSASAGSGWARGRAMPSRRRHCDETVDRARRATSRRRARARPRRTTTAAATFSAVGRCTLAARQLRRLDHAAAEVAEHVAPAPAPAAPGRGSRRRR